jgi:hypothetical protein
MATTLNTENREDGLHLTDKDDVLQYVIIYDGRDQWFVVTANVYYRRRLGNKAGRAFPLIGENTWRSLEAAEFYALAMYADQVAIAKYQ